MSSQQSLFPNPAPTVNPAADVPRVPCGARRPGRGCGEPVVWVLTDDGNPMPIDPDPVPEGNVIVTGQVEPFVLSVRVVRKGETVSEGTARFVSHFSSCPRAANFRRR